MTKEQNNTRTYLILQMKPMYVEKLSLNKSLVKSNMIYANPAENAWRIPLQLKDLLLIWLIRSNQNVFERFNYAEIINDICKT